MIISLEGFFLKYIMFYANIHNLLHVNCYPWGTVAYMNLVPCRGAICVSREGK